MRACLISEVTKNNDTAKTKTDRVPRRGKMLSVKEAIRRAQRQRPAPPAGTYSHWLVELLPRHGRKKKGVWTKNLTTDTASGFTNRRDWQAKAMGEGPSSAFATITGTATAATATSLTNSGASFPTAGQGLAGRWVAATTAAGSIVYGMIQSNTSTALTVDQWYDPTSTSGAASGSAASSTGKYTILPGQAPAAWIGLSSDATSPTSADTTLTSELTTNGFARAVGTYAHTAAASTYTLQKTFTASGTATINTQALFSGATSTSGGVMPFKAAVTSPPTLVSGDTLTVTATITIN